MLVLVLVLVLVVSGTLLLLLLLLFFSLDSNNLNVKGERTVGGNTSLSDIINIYGENEQALSVGSQSSTVLLSPKRVRSRASSITYFEGKS